jgi:hypothetical protein
MLFLVAEFSDQSMVFSNSDIQRLKLARQYVCIGQQQLALRLVCMQMVTCQLRWSAVCVAAAALGSARPRMKSLYL